ncbi:ABC transporter ATP-binding protein [Fusibacter sp. JL298sf-3]
MIEVENLSKAFRVAKRRKGSLFRRDYQTVEAVKEISFRVDQGEMVGYIGPNGAGKSTTIKMMSGILLPTSGSCHICGRIPWESRMEHVGNIGVVFGQKTQLWWDVPVIDSFSLLKDIYRIDDADYRRTFDELISTLNLSSLLNTPVRQLSLGQRMRCEIAASLIHSPKILFLDEPTIGLDAGAKVAVRQFVQKLNKEKGTTVVLTTHDMNDIEALTDRLILIGKGQKLYDGSMGQMRAKHMHYKVLVVDHDYCDAPIDIEGCTVDRATPYQVTLTVDVRKIKMPEVIQAVSRCRKIVDLSVDSQPIEEIVLNLYKQYEVLS